MQVLKPTEKKKIKRENHCMLMAFPCSSPALTTSRPASARTLKATVLVNASATSGVLHGYAHHFVAKTGELNIRDGFTQQRPSFFLSSLLFFPFALLFTLLLAIYLSLFLFFSSLFSSV